MKNFSITKKLLILLSVALTSLATLGLLAVYEMRSAQQRFDTVQATVIPSIVLLSETNAHSGRDALSRARLHHRRIPRGPIAARRPSARISTIFYARSREP